MSVIERGVRSGRSITTGSEINLAGRSHRSAGCSLKQDEYEDGDQKNLNESFHDLIPLKSNKFDRNDY